MTILIYHGKHGEEYYNISTPALCRGAFRHLFDELGAEGFYDCSEPNERELELFNRAVRGDDDAVMEFIELRSNEGYEYERISTVDAHEVQAKDFDVWGEDPECPLRDWQYEIGNNETRLGYWEWVQSKKDEVP